MLAMGQDVPLGSKLSLPYDYAAPLPACRPSDRLFEHFALQVCLLYRDDEGIHEHARRAVRPLRQLSEVYFQSTVQKGRSSGLSRADRSWNIFVHAGTGGDIARDSALASPVGRT